MNRGVVGGGGFRSLGFARDDSRRCSGKQVWVMTGCAGTAVWCLQRPAPHHGYRIKSGKSREGVV